MHPAVPGAKSRPCALLQRRLGQTISEAVGSLHLPPSVGTTARGLAAQAAARGVKGLSTPQAAAGLLHLACRVEGKLCTIQAVAEALGTDDARVRRFYLQLKKVWERLGGLGIAWGGAWCQQW